MTSTRAGPGLDDVTPEELAWGRRVKAVLVALVVIAVIWVPVAGHFWHHLGRITVLSTRAGDRVEVDVSSPSHRAGLADLTAVARTSMARTLRVQADIAVPGHGTAHAAFDFTPLLRAEEHVTRFKVKK